MIIKVDQIQEVCGKLLNALDSDSVSTVTETLELKAVNNTLVLSVTNMEYIVKTKIALSQSETFHATVNADIFLKLINHLTTEEIELTISNNILIVKSNGIYKLPMIYDNDDLVSLPDIIINNVEYEFDIPYSALMAIYNYNSKELSRGMIGSPVQKLYYIDKEGCITFTSGACVTEFSLPVDVRFLLNSKIVKLFKLLNSDIVHVKLGTDVVGGLKQVKLTLITDAVELTSITPTTEKMLDMVPKDTIRTMAKTQYQYNVTLNTNNFRDCIARLLLFMPTSLYLQPYGQFEFTSDHVNIYDKSKNNEETVFYVTPIMCDDETIWIDLNELKMTLDSVKEETITLQFGNGQAIVIGRPNVYNIIPEEVVS